MAGLHGIKGRTLGQALAYLEKDVAGRVVLLQRSSLPGHEQFL